MQSGRIATATTGARPTAPRETADAGSPVSAIASALVNTSTACSSSLRLSHHSAVNTSRCTRVVRLSHRSPVAGGRQLSDGPTASSPQVRTTAAISRAGAGRSSSVGAASVAAASTSSIIAISTVTRSMIHTGNSECEAKNCESTRRAPCVTPAARYSLDRTSATPAWVTASTSGPIFDSAMARCRLALGRSQVSTPTQASAASAAAAHGLGALAVSVSTRAASRACRTALRFCPLHAAINARWPILSTTSGQSSARTFAGRDARVRLDRVVPPAFDETHLRVGVHQHVREAGTGERVSDLPAFGQPFEPARLRCRAPRSPRVGKRVRQTAGQRRAHRRRRRARWRAPGWRCPRLRGPLDVAGAQQQGGTDQRGRRTGHLVRACASARRRVRHAPRA